MDNKKKAVLLMTLAAFSFTIMQLFVKLAEEIPLYEKVMFRNSISLLVSLSILIKYKKPVIPKKKNRIALFFRCLFGLLGVIFFFYAIDNLIMSDASILNRLSPFFTIIFAATFLKEKVNKYHFFILISVFIGILLIVKPKFDLSILPAVIGILSALFAGAAYTILRFLKEENTYTIIFAFSLFSVLGLIPFVATDFIVPGSMELLQLLMIGVFASLGQISITLSYKYAPASQVSVYNYLSVIFALITGFIVFKEIPDFYSLLGTGIVLTMAYLNYRLMN